MQPVCAAHFRPSACAQCRVHWSESDPMETYLFSLLVQAAGTILLFIVFVLLYRKFRRPAFLDWIASWAFFLIGVGLLGFSQTPSGGVRLTTIALNVALLSHVFFLLRGVWRFRSEQAVARPAEMLWAV